MTRLRAFLVVPVLLGASILAFAPAASAGGCGGPWASSDVCFFKCDGAKLAVFGVSYFWGAISSLTVTAECGFFDPALGFVAVSTLSCSGSGPGTASCSASAPYPFANLGLVGRCVVSGNVAGSYGCSST